MKGDGDGNITGPGLAIGKGVGNGISKLSCTRKVCHCNALGPTNLMCEWRTEQPWKCPFRPTWSNTPIHKIGWAKKAKNSPYVSDDYKNGYFSGDMFEVSTEGCSCRFVHLAPIRSHGGGGKIAGYSRYGCREDCEGIKMVMLTDRMYNSQYN